MKKERIKMKKLNVYNLLNNLIGMAFLGLVLYYTYFMI